MVKQDGFLKAQYKGESSECWDLNKSFMIVSWKMVLIHSSSDLAFFY